MDPTLTRADRLVGQVLGEVGALPDVFTELEINFFLLRRLLGVRTTVSCKVQCDRRFRGSGICSDRRIPAQGFANCQLFVQQIVPPEPALQHVPSAATPLGPGCRAGLSIVACPTPAAEVGDVNISCIAVTQCCTLTSCCLVAVQSGEKQGKVTKLSKSEVLMLNIGSMCTGAKVLAVRFFLSPDVNTFCCSTPSYLQPKQRDLTYASCRAQGSLPICPI